MAGKNIFCEPGRAEIRFSLAYRLLVDLADPEKIFADDRGGLFSVIEEHTSSELPDRCFCLPEIVT